MSVKRNTLRYGAAAAVLALAVILGSSLIAGPSISTGTRSSYQGALSLLVIQLTDPPHVPQGTTSLNLTYSSLGLLIGEPTGVDNQKNVQSVAVTPSGGSATLDLLKLQNVSQTIGSVSVPDGSVIYSVTFTVTSMKIDVNGTVSSVSLASGGSTFTVAIAGDHELHGTNKALLELNPVVVETPSGFKLIPSSVGVIRQSEGVGEGQVGSQHELTAEDTRNLEEAHGSASANLVALSVSGNMTTVTVRVSNTGNGSFTLNAIGIHGNFTAPGRSCTIGDPQTSTNESQTNTKPLADAAPQCEGGDHSDEVVFVPVNSTTTTTTTTTVTTSTTSGGSKGCATGKLALVNGGSIGDTENRGLALGPGECVDLSFSGIITFGESHVVLTPSTASGEAYDVHVIGSNGANLQLDCVLPLGASSCKVDQNSKQD